MNASSSPLSLSASPAKAPISLYDRLSKRVKLFKPIDPKLVRCYLCGPTVYGPPHLGHARSALLFDLLIRTLQGWGYKTRYVRNITDVGHLVGNKDSGKDKIGELARQQAQHPMEVAQHYTHLYLDALDQLKLLRPDIMPLATGHIPEQLRWTQELLDKGAAYEVNGSVYFDLHHYAKEHDYGALVERKIEEQQGVRPLQQEQDKRHPIDFALWKRANQEHLMRWHSPWGWGFPGWHLECSVMSEKYLGLPFDIHGGGLDLAFPHHACERAQNRACQGKRTANYWLHNNMVTFEGQKMGKSRNNFITLPALFSGNHRWLDKSYPPMVIRFFLLATHYRSVLDFSLDALKGAEKAYYKLLNGYQRLQKLNYTPPPTTDSQLASRVIASCEACYSSWAEDLNSPKLISHLFELLKLIHQSDNWSSMGLSEPAYNRLRATYHFFWVELLGLGPTTITKPLALVDELLNQYQLAKREANYVQVDKIRQLLLSAGIGLQDQKDGTVDWNYTAH